MSAFIPVAPNRWAEMVQAWAEVGPLRNKVSDLSTHLELRQVEIDRLRAENERLRKAGDAVCESPYLLETDEAVIAWRAAAKEWRDAK